MTSGTGVPFAQGKSAEKRRRKATRLKSRDVSGSRRLGRQRWGDGGRPGVGLNLLPKILMTKANPLKNGDAKLRD